MMDTKELLIEARAMIADPIRWYKGGYAAKLENGEQVPANHKEEYACFCAYGAVDTAAEKGGGFGAAEDHAMHLLDEAVPIDFKSLRAGGVITYNDAPDTTHADILAVFDRAIEAA